MAKFSLESIMTMTDRITRPMRKASNNVLGFNRKMKNSFNGLNMTVDRMNKKINKIGGRIAKRGMQGLAIGLALVTRQYVLFDDAIFGATARFKAAEETGTDMTKVMVNLRKAARQVGEETQFTATQAAEGLNKYALAGFTSEEAIKVLRSQVDLATVTGEEFMRVTDISSDLLGAFGGAALSSAKKIEMLKEMNALLAVGTLSANVTMEDLFETLKMTAPIATQLGISMKDVVATTSVLGSAGIKGSLAATALKNIFLRLVKPTKDVRIALNELNLSQQDFVIQSGKNKGSLKAIADIFALIATRTKGMEKVKVARLFAGLAGLRGTAGAAVIAKNIDQIREQMIRMGNDSQKVMGETAEFMRKSMGNRLKTLASAATELGFKFIEAFAGKGKKGIADLTKAIKKFDVKPIVDALKSAFRIVGFLYNILKPFLPLILSLVVAIKAWVVVQKILNVVLLISGKASIGIRRLGKAFGGVAGKVGLLSKVIKHSPLILMLTTAVVLALKLRDALGWSTKAELKRVKAHDRVSEALEKQRDKLKGIRVEKLKALGWSPEEIARLEKKRAGAIDPVGRLIERINPLIFIDPKTQTSGTVTASKTQVDVNFNNTPSGTKIKQSGKSAPFTTVNVGVN